MKKIGYFILMAVVSVVFTACGAPAGNTTANNANAANTNTNTAKPVAAAPTKDALLALEKSGWEAWKNKDAKAFEDLLSAKYVGFGPDGRTDKAAAIKSIVNPKCDVKSYSWSDEQMTMAGADVAILSFKAAQDYTCDGKKGPASTWSASVYVREGDKWKSAFYAETPVTNPKAPPAKPAAPAKKDANAAKPAETKPDAATDALTALERKAWDAWKNKDAKTLDDWAAKDMFAISSVGARSDRAAALKGWADDKCVVKAISLTDPASAALGADVSLLTFKSAVDGKCDGQAVPPEWDATIYVKDGGAWKAVMAMGVPVM